MNALLPPPVVSLTACPEAQDSSAAWIVAVSRLLSLGTPFVGTFWVAWSVAQRPGSSAPQASACRRRRTRRIPGVGGGPGVGLCSRHRVPPRRHRRRRRHRSRCWRRWRRSHRRHPPAAWRRSRCQPPPTLPTSLPPPLPAPPPAPGPEVEPVAPPRRVALPARPHCAGQRRNDHNQKPARSRHHDVVLGSRTECAPPRAAATMRAERQK